MIMNGLFVDITNIKNIMFNEKQFQTENDISIFP